MIKALAIAAALLADSAHFHADKPGALGLITFTGTVATAPQLSVRYDGGGSAIVCLDLVCRTVTNDVPGLVAFSPKLADTQERFARR